jgi:hypothetical protein
MMPVVIVERTFQSPLSETDRQALVDRLTPCLDVYGVAWKRSILSTDRSRLMCEYVAADAESVRKAQREAHAPFDRVWVGTILD